jgi:hypothetical protein
MDLSLSASHNIFLKLQNTKRVIGAASLSGLSAAINSSNVKPDIVSYDIEHWQNTPIAEQNDPVTAISKAADIVHGAGYQFAVTPDRKFLLSYYNKIDWTKVDVLGMQIQRELSNMSKYVSDANSVASFVKSVNPNTVVLSQVSFLVSDPNQIIQAVDNVRSTVDGFIIVYNSASTESPYSTVGNMDKVISHIINLGPASPYLSHVISIGTQSFNVLINSNSSISAVNFDELQKQLLINVNDFAVGQGVVNIVIPTSMMSGKFQVTIDGNQILPTSNKSSSPLGQVNSISTNASSTVISLVHNLGQHTIAISASSVIPEFPVSAVPIAILGTSVGLLLFLVRWRLLAG